MDRLEEINAAITRNEDILRIISSHDIYKRTQAREQLRIEVADLEAQIIAEKGRLADVYNVHKVSICEGVAIIDNRNAALATEYKKNSLVLKNITDKEAHILEVQAKIAGESRANDSTLAAINEKLDSVDVEVLRVDKLTRALAIREQIVTVNETTVINKMCKVQEIISIIEDKIKEV